MSNCWTIAAEYANANAVSTTSATVHANASADAPAPQAATTDVLAAASPGS